MRMKRSDRALAPVRPEGTTDSGMASVESPQVRSHSPPAPAALARWHGGAVAAGSLGLALLWSYGSTLEAMAERWWSDPQYSHGFLVPLFAAGVLWSRRAGRRQVRWQPSWWGLPVLAAAMALRLVAAGSDIAALDALSLLPALAGVVLLVGGTSLLRWSWPAIAFLGFMLPLPFSIEAALAQPLRRVATVMSTYVLQTVGCPAFAEGNVILIEECRLGVAEACSGLGMLLTFFALSTAFALMVDRPLVDRLVLVASAVPVAVAANVVRISATGVAYYAWGAESAAAHAIMHDLAGWLMMPLALAMLWLALRMVDRMFIVRATPRPLPLIRRT
jgi:exosortase